MRRLADVARLLGGLPRFRGDAHGVLAEGDFVPGRRPQSLLGKANADVVGEFDAGRLAFGARPGDGKLFGGPRRNVEPVRLGPDANAVREEAGDELAACG